MRDLHFAAANNDDVSCDLRYDIVRNFITETWSFANAFVVLSRFSFTGFLTLSFCFCFDYVTRTRQQNMRQNTIIDERKSIDLASNNW